MEFCRFNLIKDSNHSYYFDMRHIFRIKKLGCKLKKQTMENVDGRKSGKITITGGYGMHVMRFPYDFQNKLK